MNDKQQLLIDCISLLPVIGILVLITVANDQLLLWLLPMCFAENSYAYWLAGY